MQILNKMANDGPAVFYEDAFFDTLETFLTYFRTHPRTRSVAIPLEKAVLYVGDFYSLLSDVGIPYQAHWFILRLNGMVAPSEYTMDKLSLLVPPEEDLDRIRQIYRATSVVEV